MHPTSHLPSRATLFVVAFPPFQLCACVCHVCACAHQSSVCARCAGVQGRAGPVAGAHACRGCPILPTLSRHAVGWRGGVVSTGAHACFPQPPPSSSRVPRGAVCKSHTLCWVDYGSHSGWSGVLGGGHAHWACPRGVWGHTHRARPRGVVCGVTLIGLGPRGIRWVTLGLSPCGIGRAHCTS